MTTLLVEPHPLLDLAAFVSIYSSSLSTQMSPEKITAGFAVEAAETWCSSDEVRTSIRGLLRQSGFKPTGRNKPASEYLVKAATNGKLHSINLAVDACNVVSLQSGLPISVVDTRHLTQPLTVGVASEKSEYVFNPSGQVLCLAGLLCLHDANGPCANAIKDAQRTKTDARTCSTLSLIWGTRSLPQRTSQTTSLYRSLLEDAGVKTEAVTIVYDRP